MAEFNKKAQAGAEAGTTRSKKEQELTLGDLPQELSRKEMEQVAGGARKTAHHRGRPMH